MTIKKNLLAGLVFAMALSLASTNAFGAAVTPTSTIGAGTLRIDTFTVADFTGVTLSGVRQTVTSSASLKVTDATGSGSGWNVNLKASAVTSNTSANNTLKVLQPNSLIITTRSLAAEGDSSGLTGVTVAEAGLAIDDHATSPTGIQILSAAINKGMGEFTLTITTLTVTLLPKDAKAGSYSTTLTTTLTAGP